MRRPRVVQIEELTDTFGGDLTEELPTAEVHTTVFTSNVGGVPPPPSRRVERSQPAFLPFSLEAEGTEETLPLPLSDILRTQLIPTDEEAADLKALVRNAAQQELRTRRPRRVSTRSSGRRVSGTSSGSGSSKL